MMHARYLNEVRSRIKTVERTFQFVAWRESATIKRAIIWETNSIETQYENQDMSRKAQCLLYNKASAYYRTPTQSQPRTSHFQ